MDIKVYTSGLNLIGIIDVFSSLLWNRKYSTPGTFELHAPATSYNIGLLQRENLISFRGAVEAGVIEAITIEITHDRNEITAKGRFLSSYMDRRLIRPTYNFSGKVEVAMRNILSNAVAIPLVQLDQLQGFTDTVTFQTTYKNLLTYESKLADSASLGYRFKPDFTNKTIIFEIYRGLDHSIHQYDRAKVIFADTFNNISGASYSENAQIMKNVAYVGGQGEGSERTWVTVGDNALAGLERREVALNATDISQDDISTSEYIAKLSQRGEDLLIKSSLSQFFECDALPNGNFIYKEQYDIGDIVTVQKESWGISLDLRLTGMTEVYEHGNATLMPTFGNPLPESIDWEDR